MIMTVVTHLTRGTVTVPDVLKAIPENGRSRAEKGNAMTAIPSDKAGNNLSELIGQISLSHEPIEIHASAGTAVLVAEDDWRSIQETLYLLSVPGMRESIREGMALPTEECSEDPGW